MICYLSIDDTDTLDTPGSGHLLEEIGLALGRNSLARASRITRHQLFFHPLVPYTSHNSSMCAVLSEVTDPDAVRHFCEKLLSDLAAPGSDPGICFAPAENIREREYLIPYGRKAKTTLLTKEEARETAAMCGFYLNELGGDGSGIIGALAGAALRLSGEDGRFRGKIPISFSGPHCCVSDLLNVPEIDGVVNAEDNRSLSPGETVRWLPLVKTVYLRGKSMLPVRREGRNWTCLEKDEVKSLYP